MPALSSNKSLSSQQGAQEEQYVFPYHYLSLYSELHRRILHAHYLSELQLIVGLLHLTPGQAVLDLGCGDGRLGYELRGSGARYTGIDYSERAIAFARAFNPGHDFRVGDVNDLAVDRTFDAAVMMQVLEHIPPDQVQLCAEGLYRVTKPGGRLVVSVPSTNLPLTRKHYQHFTAEKLVGVFSGRFQVRGVQGHLRAGGAWARLVRMQKYASVLWPIHERFGLAGAYVRRVEKTFARMRACDPANCHTLVAHFTRL